jgi:hypothetical protein
MWLPSLLIIVVVVVVHANVQLTLWNHPRYNPKQQTYESLLNQPPPPPPSKVSPSGPEAAFSLNGCPSYDFSTPLIVGGQSLPVIVDTGSTTIAIAKNTCLNCVGVPSTYNPTLSDTASNQNMQIQGSYVDGTGWSAQEYSDLVQFPTLSPSIRLIFGAIVMESGNFFSASSCGTGGGIQYSGIMGMAYPNEAIGTTQAIWNSLITNDVITRDLFSFILCVTGGVMWFGGWNSLYVANSSTLIYTPLTTETLYGIELSDINIQAAINNGGGSLGFASSDYGTAYVDTGTTQWVLPQAIYDTFVLKLQNNTAFQSAFVPFYWETGYCWTPSNGMTAKQLNAYLPKLNVQLSPGVFLEMEAVSSYLILTPINDLIYYCPGIAPIDASYTIMGWSAFNQFLTIFDVGNSQMGFLNLTVDACSNLTTNFTFQSAATRRTPMDYHSPSIVIGFFVCLLLLMCE